MRYLYIFFMMLFLSSPVYAGGVLKQYDDYKPRYSYLQADSYVCGDLSDMIKMSEKNINSGYSCINTDLIAEVIVHQEYGPSAYIEIIVFLIDGREEFPPYPITGWVETSRLIKTLSD